MVAPVAREHSSAARALAELLVKRDVEHVTDVAERWAHEIERRDALIARVLARLASVPDDARTAAVIVAIDLLQRFDPGPFKPGAHALSPVHMRAHEAVFAPPPLLAEGDHNHEWAEGELAVVFRCVHGGCTAHEVSVECTGCGAAYLPEDVREVDGEWLCDGCCAREVGP